MPYRGTNSHKLTDEDRKKGGKKKTPAKRIANRMNAIVNCSQKCPIWPCSFQPASKKKFKGKCALKHMPPRVQKRTMDIMTKGSEGLKQHLTALVNDMMSDAELSGNFKDKFFMIKAGTELAKTFYGTKLNVTGDMNVNANVSGTISIEEVRKAMEEEAKKEKNGVKDGKKA